jgi:hypothetical protein
MRCLLDKVTIRYAAQGLLDLALARPLTTEELFALDLVERRNQQLALFISPPSFNVLQRLSRAPLYSPVIGVLLKRVHVAYGTDSHAGILGMETVATFDQPLLNNWQARHSAVRAQLTAMQSNLAAPYCYARLPLVLRPEQIDPNGI